MATEAQEMAALMKLVPPEKATHVAIRNGSWFNPSTWRNGVVPGNGADVYIPAGTTVTYDSQSNARLHTVRVDGTLNFASNQNTKMMVDTFVNMPGGTLNIGTSTNPIQANKTAQIIFTDNGPINTTWDPLQLSRGLISHGTANIYGADKLDFVALQGDAHAGATQLTLAGAPTGWRVGDQLVLGGTYYDNNGSNANNTKFHDEVLTITAINGNQISFTNNDTGGNALRFEHTRPSGASFNSNELQLYVANTTRNVSFSSEKGKATPTEERGHTMFMYDPNVEVHNAGFYDLGRTDKNKLIDDPGQNVDGTPGGGTNPRGRYPLHFHRLGIDGSQAFATGNAIVGSPGWGLVHHDSYATLKDNVVFDVVGAGIVAEDGAERGTWDHNLTIKTTGDANPAATLDLSDRVPKFDFGFNGEGYWVQGAAQVAMVNNIAVSAAYSGMMIFSNVDGEHPEDPTFPVKYLPPNLQYIANGATTISVNQVPLRELSGFQAYNSALGLAFWNHMRNDFGGSHLLPPGNALSNQARSLVDNFKLWNIFGEGIFSQYSTQIDFVNGLVVGNPKNPDPLKFGINGDRRGYGVDSNAPSNNLLYKNLRIEGFARGLGVPPEAGPRGPVPSSRSRLEGSYLANNTDNLSLNPEAFGTPARSDHIPNYFEISNTRFAIPSSDAAPTADFSYQSIGGQSFSFDASKSFDPDPDPALRITGSNTIAAYAWAFGDGATAYGRTVSHSFNSTGSHQVKLTVWDSQGKTSSLTKSVPGASSQTLAVQANAAQIASPSPSSMAAATPAEGTPISPTGLNPHESDPLTSNTGGGPSGGAFTKGNGALPDALHSSADQPINGIGATGLGENLVAADLLHPNLVAPLVSALSDNVGALSPSPQSPI